MVNFGASQLNSSVGRTLGRVRVARSYRTEKPAVQARELARYASRPLRIVERRPRRGDVHPMDGKEFRWVLPLVPREYLYGLRRIELRPRKSNIVGMPFGLYRRREKAIILYSLPLKWSWLGPAGDHPTLRRLRVAGALITTAPHEVVVEWRSIRRLSLWWWWVVVTHELGHHFRYQFRARRSMSAKEETLAELHRRRLFRTVGRRLRERKMHEATQQGDEADKAP